MGGGRITEAKAIRHTSDYDVYIASGEIGLVNINDFRQLCSDGKIKWSGHAANRLLQRGITREDVIHCIMTGEIIEEYPDYWINPAALIFGCSINKKVIHVVAGIDSYVHIVTAYHPDTEKFEMDLKTRRRR